ncbi:hypothetical protein JCM11641_006963 [Rhodosporidiobolus odoratus]
MPIKRSAEEGGRPPLARGSACHRCFSRKVRCSGQPDPSTGLHACTSCLRTARFKGHELTVARCAFGGDGLCSEEGGVTMTGEVYPNAGPGPSASLYWSRISRSASSARSHASTSSAATDFSFDSPGLGSTISPVSSSASLKSLADAAASAPSHIPSPGDFQLPPPVQYHLPPMFPHYAYPAHAMPPSHAIPPPLSIPTYHPPPPVPSASTSLPNTPAPPSPDLTTPTAGKPYPSLGPSAILTRRARAAPMSIALPPTAAQSMGISPVVPQAPTPAFPLSNSAPLAPPANWGAPPPLAPFSAAPPPSLAFPAPPAPQMVGDPLTGALQSVLTPGTLAKLPTASYDFSLAPDGTFPPYVSGAPATPSLGTGTGLNSYPGFSMAGEAGASHAPAAFPTASSATAPHAPPTPMRSLSISDMYPPTYTPGGGISVSCAPSTYAANGNAPDFDPSQWSGSFHLQSPGLTFSSSTPSWYGMGASGQQSAGLSGGSGQYFTRT